ncbi:Wzz/FepE/Etk N-terminal domain-containing protein [Modestobacter sp. NPDC049651]|uniref:YveK family protein n=1 Tax=unclassified Modestobacter TaxID=2643866 RepID=UPI0033C23D07
MDVRTTLGLLARRWLVVVGTAVVAALVVGVLAWSRTPTYTASADVLVSVAAPETRSTNVLASGSQFILQRMTSYAELATASRVLDPVATALGTDPDELSQHVAATASVDTALVRIRAGDRDPETAARMADAVARQLEDAVGDLENGTVRAALTAPAQVPGSPSDTSAVVLVALAAAGGLVLGAALVLLLDRWPVRARARSHPGPPVPTAPDTAPDTTSDTAQEGRSAPVGAGSPAAPGDPG